MLSISGASGQLGSCVVAKSISYLHDSAQVTEAEVDAAGECLQLTVRRGSLASPFSRVNEEDRDDATPAALRIVGKAEHGYCCRAAGGAAPSGRCQRTGTALLQGR